MTNAVLASGRGVPSTKNRTPNTCAPEPFHGVASFRSDYGRPPAFHAQQRAIRMATAVALRSPPRTDGPPVLAPMVHAIVKLLARKFSKSSCHIMMLVMKRFKTSKNHIHQQEHYALRSKRSPWNPTSIDVAAPHFNHVQCAKAAPAVGGCVRRGRCHCSPRFYHLSSSSLRPTRPGKQLSRLPRDMWTLPATETPFGRTSG